MYGCQNNLGTTSIRDLLCPPPTHTGGRALQAKAALHDSLATPRLRRPLSFNAAPFMRSLVPCLLLYLSSVLWLLHRPPSAAVPCSGLCKSRDRSQYSEYSHCPAPHCTVPLLPWRTLEPHLFSPPIEASAGRYERRSFPVESRTRKNQLKSRSDRWLHLSWAASGLNQGSVFFILRQIKICTQLVSLNM